MTDEPVQQRLQAWLDRAGVAYERIDHRATSSAAEAAAARGTALEEGVKAIFFKIDAAFAVFAMSADRSLHSSKIGRALKVKRLRFASRDELWNLTGLRPGAVPPFGEPVLPFPLYVDPSVLSREAMFFTAGSRTVSFRLATADYREIVQPEVFPFTR